MDTPGYEKSLPESGQKDKLPMRLWRRQNLALLAVAALVLALSAYVSVSAVVADRLSKPNRIAVPAGPPAYNLTFEPVDFASKQDEIPLRGWWLPAAGSDKAVILVHGRNGTRAGKQGELLEQAQFLVKAGYSVFTFDMRAHGESGGGRYSLGPQERWDVRAAIEQVLGRGTKPGRIALLGHSMGAATALLTAADSPEVAAVIADSGYGRLGDLLEKELPRASGLPGFFNPAVLFLGQTFFGVDVAKATPIDSIERIVPRPILFIHSQSDSFVPADQSRRMWAASGEGAELLWLVPGPEHDQVFQKDKAEYARQVVAFLQRTVP